MAPPSPPKATTTEESAPDDVGWLQQKLAAHEVLRLSERDELVNSYEAMLLEQKAAIDQHAAKSISLAPMQREVRKREKEVVQLQTSGAVERQQHITLGKVWRASMLELEAALDAQVKQRGVLEADRNRFTEAYRKKLAQLQKEADTRNNEVKRMAEKEENAMQAAAAAAGRQAERVFESKTRDMKQRADAAIQRERQQQSNVVTQLKNAAESEAAKLKAEVEAVATVARREGEERLRSREATRENQLEKLINERDAVHAALLSSLSEAEVNAALDLEAANEAAAEVSKAAAVAATSNDVALERLRQNVNELRGQAQRAEKQVASLTSERDRAVQKGHQQVSTKRACNTWIVLGPLHPPGTCSQLVRATHTVANGFAPVTCYTHVLPLHRPQPGQSAIAVHDHCCTRPDALCPLLCTAQLVATKEAAKEAADSVAEKHERRVTNMETELSRLRQEKVNADEAAVKREEAATRAAREKWDVDRSKIQAAIRP